MKRILILIALISLQINGMAQQKLFDEAISKGRQANGFYRIVNKKKKDVSVNGLKSYCKRNGYLIGDYNCIDYQRFGSYVTVLDYFEFIDVSEYPKYVFNSMNGSNTGYSSLKTKGTVFIQEKDNKITTYNGVLWSGNVKNGFIDGKGVGFLQSSTPLGNYVLFSGTFNCGFPSSQVTVKKLNVKDEDDMSVSSGDVNTSYYSAIPPEKLSEFANAGNSTFKSALQARLQDTNDYSANAQLVNQYHNNALGQYTKVKELETTWLNLKKVYEASKNDPQGILPKIRELIDIINVKTALNDRQIKDEFITYDRFLWVSEEVWNSKYEQQKKEQINKALESVNRGKAERNYKYRDFFLKSAPEIEKMKSEFWTMRNRAVEIWNNHVAKEQREKEENNVASEKRWKEKGRLIGEIKHPSGGLESAGNYWRYRNLGVIHSQQGLSVCYYNIYYRDRYGEKVAYVKVDECRFVTLSKRVFDSEGELITELSRALGSR